MNIFAQQDPPLGFVTLVFLVIGICLVVWAAIIERMVSGASIVPYQPRRRVPWQIWDLLAVVFFYVAGVIFLIQTAQYLFSMEMKEGSVNLAGGQTSTAHPIIQLLRVNNWAAFFVCGTAAVVVAPIAEEFFYRILLQGWLEKTERTWRRRLPTLMRLMPPGALPIFISSIIFAGQHFRKEAPMVNVDLFMLLLACDSIVRILTIIFSIVFLHWRVGATAVDFGWVPKKLIADVRLGLITFAAIAVPIYGCLIAVSHILPKNFAPDPIPIFFFAIALGFLYNRTHRAAPSVALHMALNATSLAMVFLSNLG
jgi:membrane protease YdiL (CAAX protease family)